jgi:hypothetical protein
VSKRVVMRLTNWSQDIGNVEAFLERAKSLGCGPRAKINYAVDQHGHPCFYIVLPEEASKALERQRKPKAPSKAQQVVQAQLKAREKAVKSGEPVPGYVKPAVRDGKIIVRVKKRKK